MTKMKKPNKKNEEKLAAYLEKISKEKVVGKNSFTKKDSNGRNLQNNKSNR